jgi:hypothetical protein
MTKATCVTSVLVLTTALAAGQSVPPQRDGWVPTEDHVCLDSVVKAQAGDGRGTVFALIQLHHSECDSVIMISPLSQDDRDLLYRMQITASNVFELYMADQVRETGGEKPTWTRKTKVKRMAR